MPAKQDAAAARSRAARAPLRAAAGSCPQLEQRQLDLIGLGLVALGALLRVPRLLRLGRRPRRRRRPSRACAGCSAPSHYLVPVALVAAGAILMLRPVLPAVRPFRAGAICLFAALTLGARGRHARHRPGRHAAGLVGRRVGQDRAAGWWGRRSTGSSRPSLGTSARTSSPSSCSSPACCCSPARRSRA